jgi:large conductance mechanosensitive channel
MSIASEFKEFAMKGNVVDMAVGVIVGAAFGEIVSSSVGDVTMAALGKLTGDVSFSDLAVILGVDPTGKQIHVKYGSFVQTTFDFIIIALVLFLALKGINGLKKLQRAPEALPPEPPTQERLLMEISDLLRRRP